MRQTHGHWLTFISVSLLALVLTSCGKDNRTPQPQPKGTQPTDPNTSPPSNANLQGNWESSCLADYEWWYGPYGYKSKLSFTGNQATEVLSYFYDESCSEVWGDPETSSTSYTPGADIQGGAKEINLSEKLPDVAPFQIFKITGNELSFGDTANGRDGESATTRPNTINTNIKYTRK